MPSRLKSLSLLKPLRKTAWFSRVRQYFPMPEPAVVDDRATINDAEVVTIDWPTGVAKPRVGIIQDYESFPRWTKYCRFLENNGFEFAIYNIHAHDWIEQAGRFDLIVGIWACELYQLHELREKIYFLHQFLGKHTYPSVADARLYEEKRLEAYIAQAHDIEFVPTYISYDKADALQLVEKLPYPLVSKIVPSSASVGVQLLRDRGQARKLVLEAFSRNGRKSHFNYFRQKNYIYFQEFVPNDGYDIRVIVVGNWVFGYYRKVLAGDFRASGMGFVEKRALPAEAMSLGLKLNSVVGSPMLVVDMLHGQDGRYYVVEYSPVCQMEFPEQLHVDGVPGVYIFNGDGSYQFAKGRYWVHELALREYLLHHYLPARTQDNGPGTSPQT